MNELFMMCRYYIWLLNILYIWTDFQQAAGSTGRQFNSRINMSNRGDDNEDDKPPGGQAKVKRR